MALPIFLVMTTVPAIIMGIATIVVASTAAVMTIIRVAHAATQRRATAAAQGCTYHGARAATDGLT
jgi:glutamate-1-semialdehyde aminotransferase